MTASEFCHVNNPFLIMKTTKITHLEQNQHS